MWKPKLFSLHIFLFVCVAASLLYVRVQRFPSAVLHPVPPKAGRVITASSVRHLHTDCPDVLRLMIKGQWKQRPMTPPEQQERKRFYAEVRKKRGLPPDNQRQDGRCGNVSLLEPNEKWRAMCDADGPTPCCYNNVCRNKTERQCKCTECYDMRTLIHAEYSTWHPADVRCEPIRMSVTEICGLLDGHTVYFIGDSLVRHLYLAFLMTIRGNFQFGPLFQSVTDEDRARCSGEEMFTYKSSCLKFVDMYPRVCNESARVRYVGVFRPNKNTTRCIISRIVKLQEQPKSLLVMGLGLHYDVHFSRVKAEIVLPLLHRLASSENPGNPKLLWAAIHAPSMLKSTLFTNQSYSKVVRFNQEMGELLRQWRVPVFDTFPMTSQGLMSLDGTHYGIAVNRLKATFLLNYLLELKSKQEW